MSDVLWLRNVRARLCQQYPRVPADEVDAMLALWLRVLEPELPAADLGAAVEQQVRAALRSMSSALPTQRRSTENATASF
ncbi:MAG: hypothetical protein ACLGIG_03115 [Actinomycetes bacterium]